MLFNSVQFLVFFPIVAILYFLLPARVRWVWLLVCSVYFYMCWKAKYILLIGFSIAVTWLGALLIEAVRARQKQNARTGVFLCRGILTAVLAANLAVLFVFKYYNFFAENLAGLTGLALPVLRAALPVGISFYTFQALGYCIDVYRGTIRAEKNPFRYALFVCFFPQLVAGPIERAENLLPQIKKPTFFDYDEIRRGLLLMGWGFFMKLVIADRLAIFVDAVYDNAGQTDGVFLLLATVLFAVQIYCDFASYSNIARGAAQVLGFRLMKNFDRPYFSRSIPEFWQRWHISLSRWFEDYIYEPVVWASKNPAAASYFGIFLVFFVSGFWHGANWTFVAWGLLHAVYRMVGAATRKKRRRLYKKLGLPTKSRGFAFCQTLCTFVLVDISYVFFRASSIGQALTVFQRVLLNCHPVLLFSDAFFQFGLDLPEWIVALLAIVVLFSVERANAGGDALQKRVLQCSTPVRWCIYLLLILVPTVFGVYGGQYDAAPFIYFQF